jgi:cytochrome c oxidase subunit 3
MAAILLFIAVIGVIVAWWLARQRLMSKPWLEQGVIGEAPAGAAPPSRAGVGLGVFLAVVGSLFVLLVSAYSIRMQAPDWRDMPVPDLLWLNTVILVASSLALHWAQVAAKRVEFGRGELKDVKIGLLTGAAFALMFLVGQVLVWRQLTGAGYLLSSNPANAFFYLMAGLHALHLCGGLVALGRAGSRVWQGQSRDKIRLGVKLCAAYWHFLLFVWLMVLAMLTGWVEDVLLICGQLLS